MSIRKVGLGSAFAFLLLVAQAAVASAHPSGKVVPANASALQVWELQVPANVTYTITTSNLQPVSGGSIADTVLHVQIPDAQGSFAFGDDNGGAEPRSSKVVITPASYFRNFIVIVRAATDNTAGTCNLTFSGIDWMGQPDNRTYLISFGGRRYNVGPFDAQTKFWTSDHPLGTWNTVLLVLSGLETKAIAYDKNSGVGGMSFVSVAQACTTGCAVILGNLGGDPGLYNTRLYWDGDAATTDWDLDGLGNSFENLIGTDIYSPDTDGDGLYDAEEVRGLIETGTKPAEPLPRWGADPTVKDLFVEADWDDCVGCANPDQYQFTAAAALQAASLYPTDIKLHIDNGVFNTNPATATTYGAFGGAGRMPAGSGYNCATLSPQRAGYFHHYFSIGGSGGQGQPQGSCSFGVVNGAVMAHELGHNLGISHGGSTASVTVNCKPHYRSMMNYAYSYRADVGFSNNAFGGVVLNPTNLNETIGLGTTNAAVLADLQGPTFRYLVNTSTGAVDWNRDGTFSTAVRGAPTANFTSAGCENSYYHLSAGIQPARAAAMAWLPGEMWPARLYLFTRRPSDDKIEFRSATTFDCAGIPWNQGCGDWSPAAGAAATLIPNVQPGTYAPAAAAFTVNGTPKMMLVYAGADQALRFQVGTLQNTDTGAMTFSTVAVLNSLAIGADPEIRDVGPGGALRVFARDPSSQRLRSWDYNAASGTWSAGKWELWSDGTEIVIANGVGITKGFFKSMAGIQAVGAFPAVIAGGNQIETARLDPATDRWIKLGGWSGPQIPTGTKLSLAYVPYTTSSYALGRYVMTFTWQSGTAAQIIMTEGNDLGSASNQRYRWGPTNFFLNTWANTNAGVPLLYDLMYDTGLRSVWINTLNGGNFFPFGDGIDNLQLKDSDDLFYVHAGLACSLGKAPCPP